MFYKSHKKFFSMKTVCQNTGSGKVTLVIRNLQMRSFKLRVEVRAFCIMYNRHILLQTIIYLLYID